MPSARGGWRAPATCSRGRRYCSWLLGGYASLLRHALLPASLPALSLVTSAPCRYVTKLVVIDQLYKAAKRSTRPVV
jgi:hypothetical protein